MSSLGDAPLMMNPPMSTLLPVPICIRVESWISRAGPSTTWTLKFCATEAPSRSVAVTVNWASPAWWAETSSLVPLTVASATVALLLDTEKFRGEIRSKPGIETRFDTWTAL